MLALSEVAWILPALVWDLLGLIWASSLGCVTYHGTRCSYDFIVSCISGNRSAGFISRKFSFPLPLATKDLKLQWGSKIKVFNPFRFGVYKMRLDDRIPNLVSELKSDTI